MRRSLPWAILILVATMVLVGMTLLAIRWRAAVAEMDAALAIYPRGVCRIEGSDGTPGNTSFIHRWQGGWVRDASLFPKATREDLDRVSTFSELESVSLSEVPGVHDSDMEWISRLQKLRRLDLTKTAISDAGLAFLDGSQLEELDISETNVTDQGLLRLAANCPRLQTLVVRHCRITPAGILRLESSSLRLVFVDIFLGHGVDTREFKRTHPACHLAW
jgi:hypothetical protein